MCAVRGDIEICIGAGSDKSTKDCFIAIEGSGWHNWGLTYMERIQRYVQYVITGQQPVRKLSLQADHSVQLRVTNKGRYILLCSCIITA
jgi:hypothetical protein